MSAHGPGVDSIASLVLIRLAGFAARLREFGVEVTPADVIGAGEALGELDLGHSDSLYWGLRACMVQCAEDLPRFDAAFQSYWEDEDELWRTPAGDDAGEDEDEAPLDEPSGRANDGDAEPEGREGVVREQSAAPSDAAAERRAPYSAVDAVTRKDFADYTDEDFESLRDLLGNARFGGPWRMSRRKHPDRGGRIDLRRTIQASLRTDGEPVRFLHRKSTRRRRRITFVCDISGSMERYSRAVLELAAIAARRRGEVEALAFATRVTRLTEELSRGYLKVAIAEAIGKPADWSGGTRVGASLATLNREFSRVVRGAAVVVASDGWDLGAPGQLAAEADLLQRNAYRVVWINPHLQDPRFEPLARGMAAALPFVDEFLPCHNFESFESLLELLETL